MSFSYPSDVTREQFDEIRPLLESVRKRTRPIPGNRKHDMKDLLDALDKKDEKRLLYSELTRVIDR